MLKNTKYAVIFSVIVQISLLEVTKAEELNSERRTRALAFQPFKSSSPDFKSSNFFIDKYFNELKGTDGGSNGPALFPNDGPPPPRPPLVVTSRPLTEQIARSELNSSPPDNTNAKSSMKHPSLYERLLNRFGNNPGVNEDLERHPYAEILKKSKNSLHGAQNNGDSVEELTSLPPIFRALGNFARNKLRKQSQQKHQEYSDEYRDGDVLAVRVPELKVSTTPRNIYREENSQFDKSQEYAFSYAVKDDHTGDDFSHKQSSSGQATNGEYRVRLPDGRMQVVTFTADEGGYKADVRYDDVQLTTGPDRKVQNIQGNRLDYEENKVKPIVESEEYEQIQSSKEYYEDYGVDQGDGKPILNDETPTSYSDNIRGTNGAQIEQFKLGRIIVPAKKYENNFPIVRYTSTPKYAFDYDNKDVVEITPKPFILGQSQYATQEPTLFDRVTPNYLSIINQIPYSTEPTLLQVDTTDESIYDKQYDQYTYTTTKAPPLKALSNHANESTRISLLDGFRNIFKSTIAPFTYKPLVNSYNNFRFNPSTTLPPATNSYNNFNYNPSTTTPNYINSYQKFHYYPSTSTPNPFNSYSTYKYSSSTPTPINYYNSYNYNPSISTPNPINSYSKYNQLLSTPKPIIDHNFKYKPSSILQPSNSYQISTLKPNFKLENENLKPTYDTILANKLNENSYRSNSYYTNQYSPVSSFNKLGLKDENKYFNGNGVFPYASASNNIASTASSSDLKYLNKINNNSTENSDKSSKPEHAVKLTVENLKLNTNNINNTVLNKTGHLLPNLHHTVTPNLYSYNNYGHLDTKKY